MPEPEDPIAAAIRWLEDHWGPDGIACPYCGTRSWTVSFPFTFAIVGGGDEELPATVTPPAFTASREFFGVTCLGCGQTAFINRTAVLEDQHARAEAELEDASEAASGDPV